MYFFFCVKLGQLFVVSNFLQTMYGIKAIHLADKMKFSTFGTSQTSRLVRSVGLALCNALLKSLREIANKTNSINSVTNTSRTCVPGNYDKLIPLNNEHPTTELRRSCWDFSIWVHFCCSATTVIAFVWYSYSCSLREGA